MKSYFHSISLCFFSYFFLAKCELFNLLVVTGTSMLSTWDIQVTLSLSQICGPHFKGRCSCGCQEQEGEFPSLAGCQQYNKKWKNHFSEMKGDAGMSVHEKEWEQEDA